jgi:hypothetical protein
MRKMKANTMSVITPQSHPQGESGAAKARPFYVAPGQATTYADARSIQTYDL